MLSAFNNLCDWLEEEVELYTLGELHERMTKMTENENEDVYSVKRLKQKPQDRYRNHLVSAEVNGRENVVCFRDMTSLIINDKWYEAKRDNVEDESERIMLVQWTLSISTTLYLELLSVSNRKLGPLDIYELCKLFLSRYLELLCLEFFSISNKNLGPF